MSKQFQATNSHTITMDRYTLIIDGRREIIRSGAMHYFRLPNPQLWWERLFKLKAAGYNAVDLYFCWAFHAPEEGKYDFSGIRDVELLLDMVEALGLYLIARPGPYINAEYTSGGLPGWLLTKPGVLLRNRREDGSFEMNEPYMEAVRDWWQTIVPKFKDRPNLLMVQVENEYATLDMEPDYIETLIQWTRELGVTVPTMHNDLYAAGLYADQVDIYAFDNYSVTQFDTNWRERAESVFSVLDYAEENLRDFCEDRPLMVAELQAGWYGTWRGYSYDLITRHLGREHIALATKSLIGQGLTVFNHYKAIGGTNWGYIGSTDTYTSYDFGAPIAESGVSTERLYEAKSLNYLLASFPIEATDRLETHEIAVSQPEHLYMVRENKDCPGKWVFLRNLTDETVAVEVNFGDSAAGIATLEGFGFSILPNGIPLTGGGVICWSTLEPLYQNEALLFLKAQHGGTLCLDIPMDADNPVTFLPDFPEWEGAAAQVEGNICRLTLPPLDKGQLAQLQVGSLRIIGLGETCCDTFWVLPDGRILIGAAEVFPGGAFSKGSAVGMEIWNNTQAAKAHELSSMVQIDTDGTPAIIEYAEVPPLIYPALEGWALSRESILPDVPSNIAFRPVSETGTDFDQNGLFEGSAWYQWKIPSGQAPPETITIEARHLWSVFLNGEWLASGEHLVVNPGETPPEPTTVSVPEALWKRQDENVFLIFVDGLGHPKGFHDDAQVPQGLISLAWDGEKPPGKLELHPGFTAFQPTEVGSVWHGGALKFSTVFQLPEHGDSVWAPLGLSLSNLPYERINILLNGVLLGRDWKQCQRQSRYYLPEGILKAGENRLELIAIRFANHLDRVPPLPGKEQVRLSPFGHFTKATLPTKVKA